MRWRRAIVGACLLLAIGALVIRRHLAMAGYSKTMVLRVEYYQLGYRWHFDYGDRVVGIIWFDEIGIVTVRGLNTWPRMPGWREKLSRFGDFRLGSVSMGGFNVTRFVTMPFWPIPVLLLLYPAFVFWKAHVQRHRRRKHNLCMNCGYNLRGNESGTCPECGAAKEASSVGTVATHGEMKSFRLSPGPIPLWRRPLTVFILGLLGFCLLFTSGADWWGITRLMSIVVLLAAAIVFLRLLYVGSQPGGRSKTVNCCSNCGYILGGLTVPRCPECGERI